MLSGTRLKEVSKKLDVSIEHLAGHVARGGLSRQEAASAIRNWTKSLYKPVPTHEDVERLPKLWSGLFLEY